MRATAENSREFWFGKWLQAIFLFFLGGLPIAVSAVDSPSLWSESIQSEAGNFALLLDFEKKRVLVMRADHRDLGSVRLRLRLYPKGGRVAVEVPLQELAKGDGLKRYVGQIPPSLDEVREFDLQSSANLKAWKQVGHFER